MLELPNAFRREDEFLFALHPKIMAAAIPVYIVVLAPDRCSWSGSNMRVTYHPYKGSELGRQLRLHNEQDDNWLQDLEERLSRGIELSSRCWERFCRGLGLLRKRAAV